MSRQLPSQLISLVHHIALNEAGWWDKSIQNFIISSVWLNQDLSTRESILNDLKNNFCIDLDSNTFERNLTILIDIHKIMVKLSNNEFKLSEQSRKNFENDLDKHEKLIYRVKEYYNSQLNIYCTDINENDCWDSFNNNLLIPTVCQLGAKTYEIISGHKTTIEQTQIFQEYLCKMDENKRSAIKKVIIGFFDPKNSDCRDYILRMVNSFFYIEAGNLNENTLLKINNVQNKNIEFNIFLDTNFLFSILNLHDNPSNEAAISLKNLITKIKNKVNIKFYVVNKTLEEAVGVLDYQKNKLNEIVLFKNIIDATSTLDLSGLDKKYFDDIKKSNKPISPDEYFSPYLKNFLAVVRNHGVELYNDNIDKYNLDQRVIDDIISTQNYQEKFDKQKTYEQLLHDISLWHFVNDKRPKFIDSHLEAKYWIVTIDYKLLAFDLFKGKGKNSDINLICMHPASLVQMLQFWVPRSIEFENAIISNLRSPIFFSEFDNNSENVALEILKRLSRFEDIEDLSEETITDILHNQALRNKIASTKDINEQINLIKDTIIEENNRIQKQLEIEKLQKIALQTAITEKDKTISDKENKIDSLEKDFDSYKNIKDIQTQELQVRLEKIEKDYDSKKRFEEDLKKWEFDRTEKNDLKWQLYLQPKYYFIIFSIIWIFLIIILTATLSYVENQYIKYSPLIFFIINTFVNLANKEKLSRSRKLLFSYEETKNIFFEENNKKFENTKPKLDDYLTN